LYLTIEHTTFVVHFSQLFIVRFHVLAVVLYTVHFFLHHRRCQKH